MAQTSAKPRFDNIAELLENLGGIPAERVCFDPPPGKATKRDLTRLNARRAKLYELIEGTLVEKPMGSPEAQVEIKLSSRLVVC